MPSIPVGFFQAHVLYKPIAGTRVCSFGIGLDWTGAGPIPTPEEMANIVNIAAQNIDSIAHNSFMSSDWSYLGVDCTYQTEEGPLVGSDPASITGTGTANTVPVNGAILVNKQTAAGGRRNRGRVFMPPVYPAEGLVDSVGVIAAPAVTNLQNRWGTFQALLEAADAQPVLFHSEAPFTPTVILNFAVQNLLATQRRRMRK